jgi:RNA recognition motif-containing protein
LPPIAILGLLGTLISRSYYLSGGAESGFLPGTCLPERRSATEVKQANTYTMAKKLYIGGLPYSTTDEELRSTFSQVGAVESANVIMDKMTGRSRGFGFVTMPNDDEAMKAIESMNGTDMGGRSITVNEAKPLAERPPRREGGFRGGNRGGY